MIEVVKGNRGIDVRFYLDKNIFFEDLFLENISLRSN